MAELDSSCRASIPEKTDPTDAADAARRSGQTPDVLAALLQAEGYDAQEIDAALDHLGEACPHDGSAVLPMLPSPPGDRPPVYGAPEDIRKTSRAAWEAIRSANEPAQFFNNGSPCYIKNDGLAPAAAVSITTDGMLWLMGETAWWYRVNSRGDEIAMRPPKAVAIHMLNDPNPPLPRLRRLVHCPVYGPRGDLVVAAGYHPPTALFLAPFGSGSVRVPHHPTQVDVDAAVDLIIHEWLGDFPFADDADRTNALGLFLLPFARDLIDGPTPLHIITKPMPGAGGTLLAQTLMIPAIGKLPDVQHLPDGEAEIQRRITAALLSSPTVVVFDNVSKVIKSANVATAVTGSEWSDREIRTAHLVTLPITNAWIATGNDVRVSEEMLRRSIPIRLDPKTDHPYDRTDFRHQNLTSWTLDNREQLVRAGLTLIQAWVASGMRDGPVTIGGFERWARIISGITMATGLPALRSNWEAWASGSGTGDAAKKVAEAWWDQHGSTPLKVRDLLPLLGPLIAIPTDGGRASETCLGRWLQRHMADRVVNGFEATTTRSNNSLTWRLGQVEE